MMPFQIRPDQALQEIQEFNTKLAHGLKTLSEIGEIDVGVTAKEGVYFEDKLALYRFKPRTERVCNPIPVLIVYALVNRPYIADLQEGRSMVQGLLDAGLDVYLIDWGYPDGADKFLTLTDYIDGYIDRCVDVIRKRHSLEAINLLGICQGGTFSLCYTALHMQKVRNLITMVTPVDFHTPMDLLSHWVRKVDVDLMVDTMGNIPGELLNWTFVSLKPFRDGADKFLTLTDYIDGYIDRCVDVIRKRHSLEAINLLGICQGGTFSLCYTALHMQKVRNLITMVTPVDFHTPMDLLSHWVRKVDVDLMVDTMGNIPGELLNWTFVSLKPFRLMGQKYMDLVNMLDDPEKAKNFMRMEKWIFDSPDQAGEAFRQFTKDFYQQNGLIKGTVKIGDRNVDLKDITVPVLNIYAAADHLVPPASSIALKEYVGTKDYTVLEFPGGHIGIYVSGKAQGMVPPAIGEWLDERT